MLCYDRKDGLENLYSQDVAGRCLPENDILSRCCNLPRLAKHGSVSWIRTLPSEMLLTFMTSFQALEDLKNVEAAFADVHRKYERTKQVVEGFKHNEDQLKVGAQSFFVISSWLYQLRLFSL